MQLRRNLGDDVLVPVNRPVDALDIVLRGPPRIQLAHRLQPPRTRRVLRTRRHPHRRHHCAVIERLEHTFDDSRGHRQVRYDIGRD